MDSITYKRKSRFPSQETKEKISSKLKGREKSAETRHKLSTSLKAYWGNPQNFPDDNERHEGTGKGWVETGDIV